MGQQILEQIERRRVEPLQIVEEQGERMFGPGEDADESPEHELKTPLRVLWREIRNGRRFSNDELQFGDDVDHEACGRAERLAKGLAPTAQLSLALAQKRSDQALKGLRQGRIRDVALVLVELARREKAARRNKHLVHLVDDGGLPDPGIPGHEHQRRSATRDDALEGGEQGLDLALSSVQFLRNQQPVRRVVFAEREVVDAPLSLPCRKTPPEVALQAGRGLVAVLGRLGE